ncbi:hypothetical protein F7725_022132 [Dissostichus mawsoni]|uniref:Uncharacterized protein n=1 Tax=Dissostichus mawsoni TaxID=36200 RepID=A0A7J5ZDR6_DISMA|nr:hypothetical protein F7725_022132 [Dissostichus mawsoni]
MQRQTGLLLLYRKTSKSPDFVSRIYEGLQTFCKYDDSSNVCRTSESSCDGKRLTAVRVSVFYPLHQRKEEEERKKRKEEEEEEGWEVELFWFDEVMQEQLLHLENKNRETPSSISSHMLRKQSQGQDEPSLPVCSVFVQNTELCY